MEIKDIPLALKDVNNRISDLEKNNFHYQTINKFIPSIGFVYEIPTPRECAKALALIKSKCDSQFDAAEELGIQRNEIEDNFKYLGYTVEEWKVDIQTRVNELKALSVLKDLNKAKVVLLKHRSKDDTILAEIEFITNKLVSF